MKERLLTIADMVTDGYSIADIGTDHGYLPIELVKTGKSPFAIAMDIVEGPLQRAKEHIASAGLSDKIECRLSDGFDSLDPGEVDAAVIAGMGGDLISEIISRKPFAVDELIVSPHTHHEKVRKSLRDNYFHIIEERMTVDSNKFYVFVKALRDDSYKDDEVTMYDYFGKLLIESKNPVLKQYLSKEIDKFAGIEQKKDYLEIVRTALYSMG